MAKKPTKAADNAYCIARMSAAKFNDKLNSREGAAEVSCIERTRLARIELGSLTPYPEEVQLLSDVYNAPELINYYCANECPIGRQTVLEIELKEIFESTVQICAALKDVPAIKDDLLDIVADGVVSTDEKPTMDAIIAQLDNLSQRIASLKLCLAKKSALIC